MTSPMNRSRSRRIKFVRTPGSETKKVFERRKKVNRHYSAVNHDVLRGVNSKPGVAKSTRVPTRKYAGHLSPAELKTVIKYSNRVQLGMMKMDDVEVRYRRYVKQMLKE